MGQALYRKYRSKNLTEIVGQEHITQALARAIEGGHISHAYLFTGPRGVGKTSIARILAYEINNLPYDESAVHLDIIEIDAASNRRIDEIRDLREKVHITPSSATYKVYIVDEVHMLTREAFNALLKTLEEPPTHAVFILATTEVHKLPETIISRTQHYSFRPIDRKKITAHLKFIAKQEGITISDAALTRIADHGGGSFRDSISLLDQIRNYADKIDTPDVDHILGVAPKQSVEKILQDIKSADAGQFMQSLATLLENGVQPAVLSEQIIDELQSELIQNASVFDRGELVKTLSKLIDVPASPKPQLSLELCLLELLFSLNSTQASTSPAIAPKPTAAVKPKPPTSEPKPTKLKSKADEKTEVKVSAAAEDTGKIQETVAPKASTAGAFDADQWPQVLSHIKKSYNTMYGILRMAVPAVQDQTLTLTFGFAFHQKRANDAKNKQIISDAILELYGEQMTVHCEVGDTSTGAQTIAPESQAETTEEPPALSTISGIFGGAELLES